MSMQFSRIVVTGNLLRFGRRLDTSNQNPNILWLYELVSPLLKDILGRPISAELWHRKSRFQAQTVYEFEGMTVTQQGLASLFDAAPSDQSSEYLGSIFEGSLVIGFELPPFMEKAFNRLSINYINAVLGPLRFLPDLSVAFRTNVGVMRERIQQFALDEDEVDYHASVMRARLTKEPRVKVNGASAVFAGQVADDMSLVCDGRFIDLAEHEHKIASMFSSTKPILFKPHPYAEPEQKQKQLRYLARFGRVQTTDENIYRLMYSPRIETVYAMNSSVVYEARFFGTRGEHFIPYRYPVGLKGSTDESEFIQTLDCLASSRFWSSVLDCKDPAKYRPHPTGLLRETLGQSWGMSKQSGERHAAPRFAQRISQVLNRLRP